MPDVVATYTTCSSDSSIFTTWVSASVTATATTSVVYSTWCGSITRPCATPAPLTEAEIQRTDELCFERREADKRAEALLEQFLSQDQRKQYESSKYFEILNQNGTRRYRLHRKWAGSIDVFEGDRKVERLCIHPHKSMPIADSLLAQKMMIETDEQQLRTIANITRLAA